MNQNRLQKNNSNDFSVRLIAAAILVLTCFGLLFTRLLWLQVVSHDNYTTLSDNNRISIIPITPNRGMIKDRNGIVLAENYSAFTLEITPAHIQKPIDELLEDLAKIIEISNKDKRRFKKAMIEEKNLASISLKSMLNQTEVAKITAQKYRLSGVDVKARSFRRYPLGETASHLIGYLGRLSQKDQERIDKISEENEQNPVFDPNKAASNYQGTHYVGKLGLEQSYEYILHGLTGAQKVEVNSAGRALRVLSTEKASSGSHLITSIDIKMQSLVEQMYGDRKGAFVAIEPSSGQVLALVSKPNFDPNLFIDGIDSDNWQALNEHPAKPLLNRALKGTYPAGSTYKPYMALAALEMGLRTAKQAISDPGYFMLGSHRFNDDKVGGHGSVDMYDSIVHSCNTYYYMLANQMGVERIHDFMKPLGYGQITGIDLLGERRGILPSKAWKQAAYKNPLQQKWYDGETISIGIGQGYNNFTILQMAHALTVLSSRGQVHKPRIAYAIENPETKKQEKLKADQKPKTLAFKPEHLDSIIQAMRGVNIEGTSSRAFAGAAYESAGKTGTAQVFSLARGEKYSASRVSDSLKDHALFTVFAPVKNPKIAISMIVENGGFGAQAAAPIARAALDYYLLNKIPENVNLDLKYIQSPITQALTLEIKPEPEPEIKSELKLEDESEVEVEVKILNNIFLNKDYIDLTNKALGVKNSQNPKN